MPTIMFRLHATMGAEVCVMDINELIRRLEVCTEGVCETCPAEGQPECNRQQDCMEAVARVAARVIRESTNK